MKFLILILLISIKCVFGRDDFTIEFIKRFVENEEKPTVLNFIGLCWGKKTELNLVNVMSKTGMRSSSSSGDKRSIQDSQLHMFLVDLECPDADDALLNATSNDLFAFPFRWLVLSNQEYINVINSTLWSRPILVSSELVLAERHKEHITMTELHKPSVNHSLQFTPRGFYNGSLFDTRPHRELYRRRKDLMGHTLIMSNVIQDNNVSKEHILNEDRLDLHNDAVAKACWVAARHCFEMLNASENHIFSYRWGYKVNGEWSGMINDIKTKKADLATNCITYKDRLEVVSFTDMVAPVHMRFIFRQPPLTYTANIFSLPFSTDVWVAMAICSAAATVMLFVTSMWEVKMERPPLTYTANIFSLPFSTDVWVAMAICSAAATVMLFVTSMWEVKMERNPTQLDGSFSDALLLTMSAVAQQGCYIEPSRAPGRIVEWSLFTALMALYAAYSANIVVLLQAPSNSIRTLAQLASSKITLSANDVDYSRFVLNKYNDSLHVGIYKRVTPDGGTPNYYQIDKGVEKIRQGLFAFHSIVEPVYRRIEETFLETEKCDLSEVDFVNGFDGFIPVKKDSPYLEILRIPFKRIRESGIQNALTRRFLVSKPRCVNSMSTFSSVGLLDMRPVIIFMLYGIIFSVMIFLAEVVCYKLSSGLRRTTEKKRQAKINISARNT